MPDEVTDPEAPHGRDADGTPLAPYGLKKDGHPRLSNRGRSAGATAPAPKKKSPSTPTRPGPGSAAAQKRALLDLVDTLLAPAAAATTAKPFERKFGAKKAAAAAGSVIIVQSYAEPAADVVVGLAQDRPGMLSWLERTDDAMPWIAALKVGGQLARALWQNWQVPDQRLAQAARKLAPMRALQMAAAIEEQAASMGITDEWIEEVRAGAAGRTTVEHEPSEENGWTQYGFAAAG